MPCRRHAASRVGAGGVVQPGGDHHARAHAPLAALLGGVDHGRRGHGDHRQVDVPGQVARQASVGDDLQHRRVLSQRLPGKHRDSMAPAG